MKIFFRKLILCLSVLFFITSVTPVFNAYAADNTTSSTKKSTAKKKVVKAAKKKNARALKKANTRKNIKKAISKAQIKSNLKKKTAVKKSVANKSVASVKKPPLNVKPPFNKETPKSVSDSMLKNPLLETTPKLVMQRNYFVDAKTAIKKGDEQKALYIKRNYLKGYPLAVWIDYYYLVEDPKIEKYSQVKQFLKQSHHQELNSYVKSVYIDYLSKRKQYKKVLELIGKKPFEDNVELNSVQLSRQCRYYEARWNRGFADSSASVFASKLYLRLKQYPQGCEGLISTWAKHGYLTDKLTLERFERAYISRNYEQTTQNLARSLSNTVYKDIILALMDLYDDPSKIMDEKYQINGDDKSRAAVLAFKRFANLNAKDAIELFDKFCKKYDVTDHQRLEIMQIFAQSFLSRQATIEEVTWVDRNLPAVLWTEDIKIMRMRKAIWFSQWQIVYDLYDHLTEYDRSLINWRYWKARSAREIGRIEQSNQLMEQVSTDRSFFGFLAATELSKPLPFNHEKLPEKAVWPGKLKHNKAAVRFFEFKVLNDYCASVEWKEVAKTSTNEDALLMAEWALSSGNIAYSISSVVAGKRWDALDYRFPKPYLELYQKYSDYSNVPISFLYGISRQESMLNPNIKSPVGAVGLMQLMPDTAKLVSRKNKWSYRGPSDLVNPEYNIRLGSAYLKDMLNRFDNNRILAAAAYNAGPGRIKIWASKDGGVRDSAMYIENIPFKETRLYVQNVILYDVIYKKLLTGKEDNLLYSHEKNYRY